VKLRLEELAHTENSHSLYYCTQIHIDYIAIYSWIQIQPIPYLEGVVEKISQHPPTNIQPTQSSLLK
jgi:hypothetical protein